MKKFAKCFVCAFLSFFILQSSSFAIDAKLAKEGFDLYKSKSEIPQLIEYLDAFKLKNIDEQGLIEAIGEYLKSKIQNFDYLRELFIQSKKIDFLPILQAFDAVKVNFDSKVGEGLFSVPLSACLYSDMLACCLFSIVNGDLSNSIPVYIDKTKESFLAIEGEIWKNLDSNASGYLLLNFDFFMRNFELHDIQEMTAEFAEGFVYFCNKGLDLENNETDRAKRDNIIKEYLEILNPENKDAILAKVNDCNVNSNTYLHLCKYEITSKQLVFILGLINDNSIIETIDLYINQLQTLPESLELFTNLNKLILKDNQLTCLPESIGLLQNLEVILSSKNQIASLPESIGQLKKLNTLVVMDNNLTTLPESIGGLESMFNLDFTSNQLTSLPDSIGQLKKLNRFYLTNNKLTVLPDSICDLSSLMYLIVPMNQLTCLPESIGQLEKIEYLYLVENQLTSLPESMGQLTSLRVLDITGNQITVLPESVTQLENLTINGFNE